MHDELKNYRNKELKSLERTRRANRATCVAIRVVERVGAWEVIGRRHADEGGLVRAAGETAGP